MTFAAAPWLVLLLAFAGLGGALAAALRDIADEEADQE